MPTISRLQHRAAPAAAVRDFMLIWSPGSFDAAPEAQAESTSVTKQTILYLPISSSSSSRSPTARAASMRGRGCGSNNACPPSLLDLHRLQRLCTPGCTAAEKLWPCVATDSLAHTHCTRLVCESAPGVGLAEQQPRTSGHKAHRNCAPLGQAHFLTAAQRAGGKQTPKHWHRAETAVVPCLR
jgi:hypothetical protein